MVQPDRDLSDAEDLDEGTIVDPRVLAERRARRAELNEDALYDRAVAAERQLKRAQQQLDGAHEQRKELAARLKQTERHLRAAQQGEHAEAQLREEVQEDAATARDEAERQLRALRVELQRARSRERELEDELFRVRREAQRTRQESRTALAAEVQDSGSDDRASLREAEAVLAERMEDERERAAAEVTLLQHELDRRVRIQEAVSRQLVELRAELESQLGDAQARIAERDGQLAESARRLAEVRAGNAGRADREAQLEALVDELVGVAGLLKEGFEQEIAAMTAERDRQLELERDRLGSRMAEMQQRATEMRDQLTTTVTELGRQLAAERAARRRAEEALEQHPDPAEAAGPVGGLATDEAVRWQEALTTQEQAAALAEERIVELEDELEHARVQLRPPPPMPPADHPALQDPKGEEGGREGGADSVIIDLARAAARLRTPPGAAPDAETATPGDNAGSPVAAAGAGPESDAATEAAVTVPEVQIGPRAVTVTRRTPSPWLGTAIVALARRDASAAAHLIQTLLPVQADRLRQDLTYDLALADHPELRVTLGADGTATAIERAAAAAEADFRIVGSAEALAVMVGGGTRRRRPPAVHVNGRRRRARRLARAMRPPVGLAGVAAAGIELPVTQILELLADVVAVPVGPNQRFTVAFAEEDGPVQAHIVACDDAPLQVHAGPPVHAAATVRVGAGGLGAFLAGDAGARVQGNVAAVGRLLTWVDAAQGLDIRHRP